MEPLRSTGDVLLVLVVASVRIHWQAPGVRPVPERGEVWSLPKPAVAPGAALVRRCAQPQSLRASWCWSLWGPWFWSCRFQGTATVTGTSSAAGVRVV